VILNATVFDVEVAKDWEVPTMANSNPEEIEREAESLPAI